MKHDDETWEGGLPPVGPARILVIDDEEIIHTSLRKILTRKGHQVETVLAARDGLDKMAVQKYDLVITDLMMPGMNGLEMLRQMKAEGRETPVVMVTGYPTIRTAVQALRLGAVDYLAKPFTRQELLAPVTRALRRSMADLDAGAPSMDFVPVEEGIPAPMTELDPGDRFFLREHSWVEFRQDGSMDVGIEESFLRSVGAVLSIEVPGDGDIVEQGFVSFRLKTTGNEVHGVFMPLSGQVVESHTRLIENPDEIDEESWIVRIIPNNLDGELGLLKRRD